MKARRAEFGGPTAFSIAVPHSFPGLAMPPCRRFACRALRIAGLCSVAWAAAGHPLHAQVLDSYFSQAAVAAGGVPADDSQIRVASEYTPAGVRVGSFLIWPELTQSVGYDSDVNGLGMGDSAVLDSAADLVARTGWSQQSFAAELTAHERYYPSNASQSSTAWSANLGGTYDLGRDQLGANYNHLSLIETPGQIGSVASQPVPYQIDIGAVSYTLATASRFSFVPSASIDRYEFDAVPVAGTGTTERWRNRLVLQQALLTRYEWAPGVDSLLSLRGTEIRYDENLPGLPRLNSTGGSLLAGLDYTATGTFRYRALVGYQVRVYQSALYGTLRAPIAEASVTWTPTRLTTLVLTLRRDIEDSASEGLSAYTYNAAQLTVAHELRRNVMLQGDVEIQSADSQSRALGDRGLPDAAATPRQTIFGAGAKAVWMLSRDLTTDVSTHFTSRHSVGARSYSETVSLLSLRFAL